MLVSRVLDGMTATPVCFQGGSEGWAWDWRGSVEEVVVVECVCGVEGSAIGGEIVVVDSLGRTVGRARRFGEEQSRAFSKGVEYYGMI